MILNTDPKRIVPAVWGFIPSWSKDPDPADGVINARAETLPDKPFFQNAFAERRCLVLADGFFEWQAVTRRNKIPHWITLKDKSPFAFAGIWSQVRHRLYGDFLTFAIVTCEPNFLVSQVHDRMPVILAQQNELPYLEADAKTAASFFVPYPDREMARHAVSLLVNSPANDRPEVLKPVASALYLRGCFHGPLLVMETCSWYNPEGLLREPQLLCCPRNALSSGHKPRNAKAEPTNHETKEQED